jgi:hypothetical protein
MRTLAPHASAGVRIKVFLTLELPYGQVELGLQHGAGHSKLHAMNTRPAYPMVITLVPHASAGVTMSMRMQMEMSCRTQWKAR